MAFVKLFYEKGWTFYWDPSSGRMYAKEASLFLGRDHHFSGRTYDRVSAIALAQAWLRR